MVPHKNIAFATFMSPTSADKAVKSGKVQVGSRRIRIYLYKSGGHADNRGRGPTAMGGKGHSRPGSHYGGGTEVAASTTTSLAGHLKSLSLEDCDADIIWVDGIDTLRSKCITIGEVARASGALAVDAHGVKLGREGVVSILTLCGGPAEAVYAVDIMKLRGLAFEPGVGLRELLQDASLPKLFFDVRADANALFYHYGVKIPAASVVDLQVVGAAASFASAARKRAFDPDRLPVFLNLYKASSSIDGSAKARSVEVRQMALDIYDQARSGSCAPWLVRPLSPILLEHAADIRFYHAMARELGPVVGVSPDVLLCATARRLEHAHSTDYQCDDKANGSVDRALADLLSGRVAPSLSSAASLPVALGKSGAPFAAGDDGTECIVCLSEAASHAVVPCGHKCLCKTCTTEVEQGRLGACPLCRERIVRMLQIY